MRMGRGKLSLNLIRNWKSRMSTFKKRKNNLMKKAYELSTLCDVPVCVLIHGPSSYSEDEEMKKNDHHFHPELHTWPPNRTHLQALLRACKNNTNFHKRKSFDLSDFFEDRRAKLQAETCKLRQNTDREFVCPNPNPNPNWETHLQCFSESQLRGFMDSLDSKLEAASAMLNVTESHQLPFTHFSPHHDTPLVQMPFIEDPDQIGLSFEDRQSLFQEHDHNNIVEFEHYTNLMSDEFEFDSNLEHLLMSGNDEFEFDNNLELMLGIDEFEFGNNLMMPGNDEFEFGNNLMTPENDEFEFGNNLMMPENDEFVFGNNLEHLMMPGNCEFELIGNNLHF